MEVYKSVGVRKVKRIMRYGYTKWKPIDLQIEMKQINMEPTTIKDALGGCFIYAPYIPLHISSSYRPKHRNTIPLNKLKQRTIITFQTPIYQDIIARLVMMEMEK